MKKLKILFTTKRTTAPATQLFEAQLRQLSDSTELQIDFYNTNYKDYDIVLFMGYDPAFDEAKTGDASPLCGVVDPRGPFDADLSQADFLIVNGLESQDWGLKYSNDVLVHHLYPMLSTSASEKGRDEIFRVGYHGNKIHLLEMKDRILPALGELAKNQPTELVLIYNIEELGALDNEWDCPEALQVKTIQFEAESYEKYLAKVDVGIIPNLIPIGVENVQKGDHPHEHPSDYLLRFKSSSNAGRIFVFSQLGIPVIADMFPSALQVLTHEQDGFICYSKESWLKALKTLAKNKERRHIMGARLQQRFEQEYSPEVQGERLIRFLRDVYERYLRTHS